MSVDAFAWESMDAAACCRTCAFASFDVSAAKSASATLDRAPVVYSVTFISSIQCNRDDFRVFRDRPGKTIPSQ